MKISSILLLLHVLSYHYITYSKESMNKMERVANTLVSARLSNSIINTIPAELSTIDDGYSVLQALKSHESITICGYKIGATNNNAIKNMGFGPFYGPIFKEYVVNTKSSVSLKSLGNFRAAEAEFCIRVNSDFPKKSTKYTVDEVYSKISHIYPSIEIASTRYDAKLKLMPSMIVADFALNGVVCIGSAIKNLPVSYESLALTEACLYVNDVKVSSETGSNVLENPIKALAWLVNEMHERGDDIIEKGQYIMTGACCVTTGLCADDKLEAKFYFDSDMPDVAELLIKE